MQASDFKGIKPYQTLAVTWHDIHVRSATLDPEEYIENYKPCVRRTAGFFLGIKHGHLFIAETDDREANTDEIVERINAFPLQIIVAVQ